MPIYRLNTKIRLTMLCLSGFELYYRWVLLINTSMLCSVLKLELDFSEVTAFFVNFFMRSPKRYLNGQI